MSNKMLVQIGAGKIGRGYIADLFNEAGFHIVFTDYSEELSKALRDQGFYTIFKHHSNGTYDEVVIRDYESYCTQSEYDTCVQKIAETSYVSANIFPGAVDSIAKMLADAITLRLSQGNEEPMDILLGVNFLHSSVLFKEGIIKYLKGNKELEYFSSKVGLIECLVHRNGAFPTEEMLAKDPLACNSGDTPYLTVDDSFKGTVPEGVNLILRKNVPLWMIHKIWVANMSHSFGGYLGKYKGYRYIGECRDDAYIMKAMILARREACYAMNREFGLSYEEMEEHDPVEKQKASYLDHVANSVDKDTIDRVCGDLTRKLAKGDRLIGPALACLKHDKAPYFLSMGAAYALYFNNENDPTSVKVQEYIRNNGVYKALEEFSGLSDDVKEEKMLKEMIAAKYFDLSEQYPFDIEY